MARRLLDDGRLLYALATGSGADRWDKAQIIVQSLASGERHIVVRGGSAARYLPTSPDSPARGGGHLVYAVGNSLVAAPFDATRLELRGAPVPIVEPVNRSANTALQSGVAQYAVSATGMLAYLPGRSSGASLPKAARLRWPRRQDPDARPAAATVHSPAPVARRPAARRRHRRWEGRQRVGLRPQVWWLAAPAHVRRSQSVSDLDARRPLHHLPIGSRWRRCHLQTTGRWQRSRRTPDASRKRESGTGRSPGVPMGRRCR